MNVFYKISYKDYSKKSISYDTSNLEEAIKFYNTLDNTFGISDLEFFIVNVTQQKLTKEQLPIT